MLQYSPNKKGKIKGKENPFYTKIMAGKIRDKNIALSHLSQENKGANGEKLPVIRSIRGIISNTIEPAHLWV